MTGRILFVGLSVVLLGLVAWAAFKDSATRTYINIQQQYLKDYPTSDFNVQVQQLFPAFPQATIEGDTYRVERCISCHVPDIGTIGPAEAAKRLSEATGGLKVFEVGSLSQALADLRQMGGVLGRAQSGPPPGPGGHTVPYAWQTAPWS